MGSQHPRGVFSQPYTSRSGEEILLAVDSEGRVAARAHVPEPRERFRYRVRDLLRAILDLTDPPSPSLRVVE